MSAGRRNVKVYCLLAKRCWLSFAELLQSEDLHQMFICACPGVVVTTPIKDFYAPMFYSYFMRQPYLNYLTALILYMYKHVNASVHNCSAALSMDVYKFSVKPVLLF